MVPVKSTVWSDDSFAVTRRSTPRRISANTRRSCRRKSRARAHDHLWFLLVAVAIITFVIAGAVSSIKSNVENALSPTVGRKYVVGVKVKPGDTLWTYARRYGAPGSYILERVDAIASDNGLDPSAALVPGQTLRVRVENPTIVARLDSHRRVATAVE